MATPNASRPQFVIRLRPAAWHDLRRATSTESDQALGAKLGLDRVTVYRVTTGAADVSTKFVAHTLAAFRFVSFDRLFEWAPK